MCVLYVWFAWCVVLCELVACCLLTYVCVCDAVDRSDLSVAFAWLVTNLRTRLFLVETLTLTFTRSRTGSLELLDPSCYCLLVFDVVAVVVD